MLIWKRTTWIQTKVADVFLIFCPTYTGATTEESQREIKGHVVTFPLCPGPPPLQLSLEAFLQKSYSAQWLPSYAGKWVKKTLLISPFPCWTDWETKKLFLMLGRIRFSCDFHYASSNFLGQFPSYWTTFHISKEACAVAQRIFSPQTKSSPVSWTVAHGTWFPDQSQPGN